MTTTIGYTTRSGARRRAVPADGDRLIQLCDGSWGVLGTPGYDNQGEPVQWITLPRGREVRWQDAVRRGWVQP